MVQDAKLRVAAFFVKIEGAVFLAVEIDAPVDEALDASGSVFHHLLDGGGVADIVASYHRVVDVFLKIVFLEVGDGRYATLSLGCVSFVDGGFAYQGHLAFLGRGHLQSEGHACHSAANNEEIKFANHRNYLLVYNLR